MKTILIGDCRKKLKELSDKSIQMCVTSPPYWGLRDYGHDGQLGLEETPAEYVANMVSVFSEVKRVLRDDGTLWLNLGDSYANKDLVGIPWRVAFALQADGWYLRQDIIWHKPNPMPESVKDRCTKAHEYIFLLSKSAKYYYDAESIREPAQNWGTRDRSNGKYTSGDVPISGGAHSGLKGKEWEKHPTKNKRSVWSITPKPYKGAHFAVFPTDLVTPCILAGSREGDTVLDPFLGSGTTGSVCDSLNRKWVGVELNADYQGLHHERISQQGLGFG